MALHFMVVTTMMIQSITSDCFEEEEKLSLHADEMMLYLENPEDSRQKLVQLVSGFSKVAGYKINMDNQLHFFILTMKHQKRNVEK